MHQSLFLDIISMFASVILEKTLLPDVEGPVLDPNLAGIFASAWKTRESRVWKKVVTVLQRRRCLSSLQPPRMRT